MITLRASAIMLAFLAHACVLVAAEPPTAPSRKSAIPIARETTFYLAPLDAAGGIDYLAALDDHSRRGVATADNTLIPIWHAFGPKQIGNPIPAEYFVALGMKPPELDGRQFLTDSAFADEVAADDPELKEKLFDQFYESQTRPWAKREFPAIAEWVRCNEVPFALATEASKRTKHYRPLLRKSPDSKHPLIGEIVGSHEIGHFRELGRSFTCRAYYRLGEREFDGAWDDVMACRRLARLAVQGPTIVEYLVGCTLEAQGRGVEERYFAALGTDSVRLRRALNDIRALKPLRSPLDQIENAERATVLDTLQLISRGDYQVLPHLTSAPNDEQSARISKLDFAAAMRRTNLTFDRIAAALRSTDRGARRRELARIEAEMTQLQKKYAPVDPDDDPDLDTILDRDLGDFLTQFFVMASFYVIPTFEETEQRYELILVGAALAAYHADHNRWPDRLDALQPLYLPTAATDHYTGTPLRYLPAEDGFLLYSCGKNGRDDAGRDTRYDDTIPPKPNGPADDLAFRVKTAKP